MWGGVYGPQPSIDSRATVTGLNKTTAAVTHRLCDLSSVFHSDFRCRPLHTRPQFLRTAPHHVGSFRGSVLHAAASVASGGARRGSRASRAVREKVFSVYSYKICLQAMFFHYFYIFLFFHGVVYSWVGQIRTFSRSGPGWLLLSSPSL